MKIKLPVVALAVIAVLVLVFYFFRAEPSLPLSQENTGPQKVAVKRADAPVSRAQGLSPDDVITFAAPADRQWWHDATVYQIWVRSFFDKNDDGHGDLAGIAEKLDYLKSLGVDALWLTPIFESPSYHGYDAVDFYRIDEDYGSMQDFQNLIAQAKQKDIKVILDLALNHVSEAHPWFKKALANDPEYADYFVWRDEIPKDYGKAWEREIDPAAVWHSKSERAGFYYGAFGWSQPDLNYHNPAVANAAKSVAEFWLNKGVDGFRLDAIRYLVEVEGTQADAPETLAFWREFAKHVKSIQPQALLVGEALTETAEAAKYFDDGKGIDQVFEFGFNYLLQSIVQTPHEHAAAIADPMMMDAQQISHSLRQALWANLKQRSQLEQAPEYFFASFLNNHDHDRLNSFFGLDEQRAKIAAALLLLRPGTVYLYYGEEVGMKQHNTDDDMYRRSLMQWDDSDSAGFNQVGKRWLDEAAMFPWLDNFTPWWSEYWQQPANRTMFNVAQQETRGDSILAFYKTLINVRKHEPILRHPEKMWRYPDTGFAWVVEQSLGTESRIIIINLNADESTVFAVQENLQGEYRDLISQETVYLLDELELLPGQAMVLKSADLDSVE